MKSRVVITFEDSTTMTFTDNTLKSLETSEALTDTNMSITPGVCEQYATIVFYDRFFWLRDRAKKGLSFVATIQVYYTNMEGVETLIGEYDSSEWDVMNESLEVKLKCRDKTYILDNITVPSMNRSGNKNLNQLLTVFFQEMHDYPWAYLDYETSVRCSSIVVADAWHYSSTLKTLLNKVCYLGMLRIFYKNGTFYVGRSI